MGTKKPSLAMIIPGGVGTGKDNIGVPVLLGLIRIIAARYDLTVFQLSKTNKGFHPEGFDLVSVYHSNPVTRVLRFPFIFRRYHQQKKFSAVHGFWAMPTGMLAVIVGKLFRIRSIVSLLGGDAVGLPEINYGRLHKPFMRRLIFWTLRNATHSNALTKYLVDNLRSFSFEGHVDVIPWGVDRDLFDYHPKPYPFDKSFTFLHVANLHPVKDQEMLLRTFNVVRKNVVSKLIIIGSGVNHQKVLSLIEQLNLHDVVEILNPVRYEKLPAFYHRADVLLHTSRSEGQSEVVTEAMSCGLPVCGTPVGLIYDLSDCCVSDAGRDHELLAQQILALINDPVRMNDIRMRANEWTTTHDIMWTANEYLKLYGS